MAQPLSQIGSSLGSRSKALREGNKKHIWRSFPVNKYLEEKNFRVEKFQVYQITWKEFHTKFTLTKMSDH